ncbi:hypothetical protein A3J90_03455 [candidate division WOR-1 bacterium RIFOXYC2_FULL_37_10]|uniref:Glycosyltransferase RgtA/B/C/D-like domain-containing protein n=1 Tax=candidate division WOR-1 bacterium RIFOXYB2_FULL_37_13 TaxID=1802579 RepID=A0A1F4SVM1_UNCSA|nr:MAG: hypothetical protein A2246_01095 [candidate division WOR-1 bacterium RIFOXYA2_FULL_37_7]OGC24407.1 MAG: hypothetical protein A2310_08360 [candidate division WOR-1 bacterium RIFOXYB2_FULL_37_13]OGC37496.1 MAG: hypothetical protein A3J90_03455 [candidate division WOR-1 bacterium RIFOXYC2_FULL_37_10]
MKTLFLNRWFQVFLLAILIVIFWYPICSNEFFYDDWTFINKVQSGNFSFGSLFFATNGHFAPIFTGLFFVMLKLFGLNIVPYMCFSIFMQILTCSLLFYLLTLIFPQNKYLPFLLALYFSLNTVYFEILHWFSGLGQSFSFLPLLLTLIFLHRGVLESNKKFLAISVITSFFIPMHYSMGFTGIGFIFLYYLFVLNKYKEIGGFKRGIIFFLPYVFAWLLFFVVYLIFALPVLLNQPDTAPSLTFNVNSVLAYTLLGFTGLLVKNLGYSILVFPYTTGLAVLLTFFFIVFFMMMLLYFFLTPQKNRIALFFNRNLAIFSFITMFFCYSLLAFARASLGVEAFLSWGRYHYFPMFSFTILLGAVIPQVINIFSKLFDRRRFKIFLVVIFILFLMTHFILIRQKSESPIRTEGALPAAYLVS